MALFGMAKDPQMITSESALAGRDAAIDVPSGHFVNNHPLQGPWPEGIETAIFGLGCFWGAERIFWETEGVYSTAVGYAGGFTPNATYREVCSGRTGHTEAVLVAFDPSVVTYKQLLKAFWEGHDPTQGMRQGNDSGTQYRSAIYTIGAEQAAEAADSRDEFQKALTESSHGAITTEIAPSESFFYAEPDHQQYLAKNPGGYCGLGGTGVTCPVGLPKET